MWKRGILAILALLLLAAPATAATLHKDLANAWKGQTNLVEGREFKFLVDPAKVNPDMAKAFKEIWDKAKAVAASKGISITEREKKPFALSPVVKTFFDTEDMKLWKAGYLIRVTINYKKGYPSSEVRVMIKRIGQPAKTILAGKMSAAGDVKAKCSIEDNIGINADGSLYSYLEQGLSFRVERSALGDMELADFGKFAPFLLKLGLPANTKLVAYPAFGTRCRPGFIALPGLDKPVAVSMEAWARTDGGAPFVYDYSYGYDGDFDKMTATHAAGEDLLTALYKELNPSMGFENPARWGGSKVRVLLGQPRK